MTVARLWRYNKPWNISSGNGKNSRRDSIPKKRGEAYLFEQKKTILRCSGGTGGVGAGGSAAFCRRQLAGKAQPETGDPDGAAAGDR